MKSFLFGSLGTEAAERERHLAVSHGGCAVVETLNTCNRDSSARLKAATSSTRQHDLPSSSILLRECQYVVRPDDKLSLWAGMLTRAYFEASGDSSEQLRLNADGCSIHSVGKTNNVRRGYTIKSLHGRAIQHRDRHRQCDQSSDLNHTGGRPIRVGLERCTARYQDLPGRTPNLEHGLIGKQ